MLDTRTQHQTTLHFKEITLSKKTIPFISPLKTATTVFKSRKIIVLSCLPRHSKKPIVSECSFLEGLGDTSDSLEACYHQLSHGIKEVTKYHFQNPLEAYLLLEDLFPSGFCRSALDDAYWALYAKKQRRSLASVLGGPNKAIPYRRIVSLNQNLLSYKDPFIKLKVNSKTIHLMIDHLKNTHAHQRFYLDANASLTEEHIPILCHLKGQIAGIEQPFHHSNKHAYALCHRLKTCPIYFDESIKTPQHAKKLIKTYPKFGLSIKATLMGGITPCLQLITNHPNRRIRLGGCFESDIGRAYLFALANHPGFETPCDGGPSRLYLKQSKPLNDNVFYYACPSKITT